MTITKTKKLTNKDRKKAFFMKQNCFSQSNIAQYFKKSKGAISKLFKNKEKFERLFKTPFVNDSTKKNIPPMFPEIEEKLQEVIKDFRKKQLHCKRSNLTRTSNKNTLRFRK